jgi:hypothetical protein
LLEKRDWRRAILFGGLGLDEASAGAGKVLLLALAGGVGLAQPAAVMAIEGALGPVHLADWVIDSVVDW